MGWEDPAAGEIELAAALATFDWEGADESCRSLIDCLRRDRCQLSPERARSVLQRLRRKRRFQAMALVAEALVEAGLGSPRVGLQYAQALIDTGALRPAELLLATVAEVAAAGSFEDAEVRGLRGRIHKQRYVNAANGLAEADRVRIGERYRGHLASAIAEYLHSYRLRPVTNHWHGINAVALILRAGRDHVPLDHADEAGDITRSIVDTLQAQRAAHDAPPVWELATALEARVALGDPKGAEAAAFDYAASDGDAFEFASTLRQLTEVWLLTDEEPLGRRVLPILRAALLRRQGGGIQLDAKSTRVNLEKVFGADRFQTLEWYQKGLNCCASIARIETLGGTGHGTGWLVQRDHLFGDGSRELLLVTNAHVISPPDRPYPDSLRPEAARVNFRTSQTICPVDTIEYSSPVPKLDVTIVKLKTLPAAAAGLTISEGPLPAPAPDRPARLYVIGYPSGRDLEFSLHDNAMLGSDQRVVHYRTPTEGGSSGSPVFEDQAWRVVALHHAGRAKMSRLDGQAGMYEANEGLRIDAIREAIRAAAP